MKVNNNIKYLNTLERERERERERWTEWEGASGLGFESEREWGHVEIKQKKWN